MLRERLCEQGVFLWLRAGRQRSGREPYSWHKVTKTVGPETEGPGAETEKGGGGQAGEPIAGHAQVPKCSPKKAGNHRRVGIQRGA